MSTAAGIEPQLEAHNSQNEDHWISVSDLMAGLMLVFMFVSVALLSRAHHERDRARDAAEKMKNVAVAYQATQGDIYEELRREFEADLDGWHAAVRKETLSFEFQSPEVLFDTGEIEVRPRFKAILVDFFPRYLAVLGMFKDSIAEIRIEGHTSSVWMGAANGDEAYFENMRLSQGRTRSVLDYAYRLPAVETERPWIKANIAAVGLSSSQRLMRGDGSEDREKSRRVSFRVITNADTQIRQILEKAQ